MTAPALAARRFLLSCLLGCLLGILYGALRPLRRRKPVLGDLLFLPAAVWLWLEVSFRICRGDLRLGYSFGLFAGCFLWEATAGRLLRPVFEGIWKGLEEICCFLLLPLKKFLYFVKKLFASVKKWVTIECTNLLSHLRRRGRRSHGSSRPAVASQRKHPAKRPKE